MSKTVWIINQYASTPKTGMGGRHYYLAKELAGLGHKVYLIAGASSHLLRERPELRGEVTVSDEANFKFVWIELPHYVHAHSKQRVFNWFIFSRKLKKLTQAISEKPDTIYYSSPSLVGAWGARKLAAKLNAKFLFEVRDIWPLTLCEIGGYSKWHPFIQLLQWIEDKSYRAADVVISNLKNSYEHMKTRGMDEKKFAWIPNGYSEEEVQTAEPLDPEVVQKVPSDKFVIGYTGTLGAANAMDSYIDAISLLGDREDLCFVIVGNGREKESLQARAQNLKNVIFIEAIPKSQIHSMLKLFDVCFIGWRDTPLYRFGIGANKIPEYLYSGRPILHAYSGGSDPVQEYGAGVTVPAEDSEALAAAMESLARMSKESLEKMGKAGSKAAESEYSFKILGERLERLL